MRNYVSLSGIGLEINFQILPQKLAIPSIINKDHLLLCSPTGSGKTLTAFLSIIDELVRHALNGTLEERVYCLYISPIKALANDIQKNLIGPLEEIEKKYLPDRAQGKIRVGLRTGDTPQSERQKMLRKPPHILITTPESMAIAISSPRFQPIVSNVEWKIIDEMHSLVTSRYNFGEASSKDWYLSNDGAIRNSS